MFVPSLFIGQTIRINGIVTDKSTNQPLAFVNIVSDDNHGAISDIDGKFTIITTMENCCLTLSYIGYSKLRYTIDPNKKIQKIELSTSIVDLEEVTILPGINPAHRIINNVIDNRNINNPEKLDAFTYTSYDKLVLTVDADSIMNMDISSLDSNQMELRKLLDKQHLFLLETVTERMYMSPGLNQENVLATRVSGLNDPLMAFMISQVQSTSFYDEHIEIAGNDYINPISKGSTNKYMFLIEDTTYNENHDTIFIISFRPKINTRFTGMKGFLHINSNKWAIQNVKAEPHNDSTGIRIKIQQAYEFIEDQWFPVQLVTDIVFNMANASDGQKNYPLIGHGKSYIRDINLNPDIKKSDFGYSEVEVEEGATKRKGEFWNDYRVDSLTAKELETYRVIDSIGKAENFDKIAGSFQTLLSGQIPAGFINIDIDKFIHYNEYEGLYLGVGAHTNQRVSKLFTIGGYWGYGFRDKNDKYGADLTINVHKRSESLLRLDVYNSVTASGNIEYFDDNTQIWKPDNFYEFFFKQMNTTKGGKINYSFRIKAMRDFNWNIGLRSQKKYTYDNYYFVSPDDPGNLVTDFRTSEISFGFRFAFREKTLQTTRGRLSMGSDFPILWLNYTHGIKGIVGGDYTFSRLDMKVNYTHNFKFLGESTFVANAGIIFGKLPISELYSGVGSYSKFTIYAPGSFGTMRPNEFYSNRYISLFLSHNFKNLLFSFGNYKPELIIVTNIALGSLDNATVHKQITFNTLEKGYYESGIVIRKLLDLQIYDLGAGVMYRYGPYGFDNIASNFAYKISLYYAF